MFQKFIQKNENSRRGYTAISGLSLSHVVNLLKMNYLLPSSMGVRQYVILGAGLDTFAYRNPYSYDDLKVFEVDHPASQKWKRQQLDAAKIPIPKNLILAPIDFENQTLADQLQEAGFKADEPSFFSWLGVTMYLNRETMMATMNYIASWP